MQKMDFASLLRAAQNKSPLRDQQVAFSLTDLVLDAVMRQEASCSTILLETARFRTAASTAPCTDPERGAGQCSNITVVKLISAQCLKIPATPVSSSCCLQLKTLPLAETKVRSGFYFHLLAERQHPSPLIWSTGTNGSNYLKAAFSHPTVFKDLNTPNLILRSY